MQITFAFFKKLQYAYGLSKLFTSVLKVKMKLGTFPYKLIDYWYWVKLGHYFHSSFLHQLWVNIIIDAAPQIIHIYIDIETRDFLVFPKGFSLQQLVRPSVQRIKYTHIATKGRVWAYLGLLTYSQRSLLIEESRK